MHSYYRYPALLATFIARPRTSSFCANQGKEKEGELEIFRFSFLFNQGKEMEEKLEIFSSFLICRKVKGKKK